MQELIFSENNSVKLLSRNETENGKIRVLYEKNKLANLINLYLKLCQAGLQISVEERGKMDNIFLVHLILFKKILKDVQNDMYEL